MDRMAEPRTLHIEKRGQHLYFEAPSLDSVYAFAKAQGIRVLDAVKGDGVWVAKVSDTP